MQDRRRLIELIQSLSMQESARQPSAEDWLRAQDEKARDSARPAPDNAEGDRNDGADDTPEADPPNAGAGPTA